MSLNTTPRTWTTGELVTAALHNTEIRDALTGIQSAWDTTSWVPGNATNWTAATTAPAIGNGTSYGEFQRVGKMVDFRGRILPGSTTTFGAGAYEFLLPVSPTGATLPIGTALLIDASTGIRYIGVCQRAAGGGFQINFDAATAAMSPTVPVTFASSDALYFQGCYPAA